jgi:hypothetical protein
MDNVPGPSTDQLNAPYAQRWELLKAALAGLFLDEKKTYKEIVEILKRDYQFYATSVLIHAILARLLTNLLSREKQYKRQFGLWGLKRAIPTEKKVKICQTVANRAQHGKSSVILHHGKVEVQKMRRHLKAQIRRDKSMLWSIYSGSTDIENLSGHALQCGNRV